MADPTQALHEALLIKLNDLCTCAVWDAVPQNAPYPYVVVDNYNRENMDGLTARRDDRQVYLSVWSEVAGQAEVNSILEEIGQLHNADLPLTTGTVASLRVMRSDTNRDADGVTFMGRATLRILTSH